MIGLIMILLSLLLFRRMNFVHENRMNIMLKLHEYNMKNIRSGLYMPEIRRDLFNEYESYDLMVLKFWITDMNKFKKKYSNKE